MRCNKHFFNVGFEVLFKNVALRLREAHRFRKAIERYIEQDERGSFHFPHIRTLRIIIPGDGRDYGYGALNNRAMSVPDCVTLVTEPAITALQHVLPFLSKLRTFSIMTHNGHRLNTWDDYLGPPPRNPLESASATRRSGPSTNLLARLINALPPDVRDLSIDLSELSKYEPLPKCELCPAINKLAPRLEHLNLHLRSYCNHLLIPPDIQAAVYPLLRSVILRIHGFSARICTKTGHLNQFYILNLDTLTRRLKMVLEAGGTPNLKQFIIISKRRPHGIRQHSDAKWTIYVRELVSNQTAAIPRIFIDSRTPTPGNTFIASARTTIRLPAKCSFINPTFWDKEYVGKSGSIRRFVEGQAGWVCFAHGPHVPGLRAADVNKAYEQGYEVRAAVPTLVSKFREVGEKSCGLWADEERAGMKLLEPAVWNGVLDSLVLRRADGM